MNIGANIQRDAIAVDRVSYFPVPLRVTVAQILFACQPPIGDCHQRIRHGNGDIHALLRLVLPLVFAWPVDIASVILIRGKDPRTPLRIGLEAHSAEPSLGLRRAGIVEVDGVGLSSVQRLRKVDKHRAGIPGVDQFFLAQHDLLDHQNLAEIELNARAVGQHLEAHGIHAGNGLAYRIDANIEVVVEQIVVRSVRPVGPAQDFDACRRHRGWSCLKLRVSRRVDGRGGRRRGLRHRRGLRGKRRRQDQRQ